MKRTLILIANIGTPDNPAYGARKDIDDYKSFFRSDEGGAWEENEILTFLTGMRSHYPIYFYFRTLCSKYLMKPSKIGHMHRGLFY